MTFKRNKNSTIFIEVVQNGYDISNFVEEFFESIIQQRSNLICEFYFNTLIKFDFTFVILYFQ